MAETEIIENQPLPFATVVIHDHAGLDIESHLDRDGIFRVNPIGRAFTAGGPHLAAG